jgi:hypothetical protein
MVIKVTLVSLVSLVMTESLDLVDSPGDEDQLDLPVMLDPLDSPEPL